MTAGTPSEQAAALGATLQQTRQERKLTRGDVAAKIRIPEQILAAMEAGNFARCGGDIYVRGHLRNLADLYQTSSEGWLEDYERLSGSAAPKNLRQASDSARKRGSHLSESAAMARSFHESDQAHALQEFGNRSHHGLTRSSKLNWSMALLVVFIGIVAVGVISVMTRSGSVDPAPPPAAAPSQSATGMPVEDPADEKTPEAVPPVTPTETIPVSPSDTPNPSDVANAEEVTVTIAATGDCWVRVIANPDEPPLFEDIMTEGQVETFKDAEGLSIKLGSAGAVKLTVNGQDLGSPGDVGQVMLLNFGPEDLIKTQG